jgi:hypothetical protein
MVRRSSRILFTPGYGDDCQDAHSLKFLASELLSCISIADGGHLFIFSDHSDFKIQPKKSC